LLTASPTSLLTNPVVSPITVIAPPVADSSAVSTNATISNTPTVRLTLDSSGSGGTNPTGLPPLPPSPLSALSAAINTMNQIVTSDKQAVANDQRAISENLGKLNAASASLASSLDQASALADQIKNLQPQNEDGEMYAAYLQNQLQVVINQAGAAASQVQFYQQIIADVTVKLGTDTATLNADTAQLNSLTNQYVTLLSNMLNPPPPGP